MRTYNSQNNQKLQKITRLTKASICLIVMLPLVIVMLLVGEALLDLGPLMYILSPLVWAKTEIAPDALDGFRDWYGKVSTFKSDFHQKTLNPIWGEEQEARGGVWFKKPGLMHWKYSSPQQDTIIINQEGFFWYMPEDNQLIKRGKKEAFETISPMSILGENMELERDFEITGREEIHQDKDKNGKKEEVKDGEKTKRELIGYALILKPKNPKVAIKNIRIEVKARQFSLSAIEVEETSGNRNRIEFDKLEINKEVSPDLFKYTPLPGTKVITPEDFPSLGGK